MRHGMIAVALIATFGVAATGLAMAGAPASDWSSAREVDIELSSFKFTPSVLSLEHGVAYRLHLTNAASGGHNFAAKELFDASSINPDDRSKIDKGRVEVEGRETVDIRLIPMRPGRYQLKCSHFMHTTFGMVGTINVS